MPRPATGTRSSINAVENAEACFPLTHKLTTTVPYMSEKRTALDRKSSEDHAKRYRVNAKWKPQTHKAIPLLHQA